MPECHTLVVSDIHLGSRVCRSDKILNLLKNASFDTLVINGDLFDGETERKFTEKHWEILHTIEDIARRTNKVYLIAGNHGRELDHLAVKHSIQIFDEFTFKIGNNRFLCLHGDQFDIFIKNMPKTSRFFTSIYEYLQVLGGETQRFSMFMKRLSKSILRVPLRQQRLALAHAGKKDASVIICSHTHLPHEYKSAGVHFINTGSFCEYPCNYVTIDHAGNARLMEI